MYENIIEQIREKIDELEAEARAIAHEHWDYHIRENVRKAPEEKGRLNVYVRRKRDTLEIHWSKFKFIKPTSGGPSKIRSTYLRKGKSHVYPSRVLTVAGQAFELEVALETEERLGAIRSEAWAIGKILRYLREAEKRQRQRVKLIEDSEGAE